MINVDTPRTMCPQMYRVDLGTMKTLGQYKGAGGAIRRYAST